jgi:hypothetical protein
MRTPPSRDELSSVIGAIKPRSKPVATDRAAFVMTAMYLQRNEGVEPAISITLRTTDFDFDERWVEFKPFHRSHVVRRRLSDETAEHILSQMALLGTKPGDRLTQWAPRPRRNPKPSKHGKPVKRYSTCNEAVANEVRRAGFDPRKFSPVVLKWAWLDENPGVREQEVRANILASFVLRWAKPRQQEALFGLLYKHTRVLRPGWATPRYETEAQPAPAVPDEQRKEDKAA